MTPYQALEFIEVCRQFAEERGALTGKHFCLDKYLRPENQLEKLTLYQVFMRVLFSSSNANMKAKVIDFSDNGGNHRRSAILKSLFPNEHLDVQDIWSDECFTKFLKNNLSFDVNSALQRIKEANLIKGKGQFLWAAWLHTVLDALNFVSEFRSGQAFVNFIGQFKDKTAFLGPIYLSRRIFGLGFALSCDTLKELGFVQFVKPDIHIMRVLESLGLSKGKSQNLSSQLNAFDALIELVNQANKSPKAKDKLYTPYSVDKLIWLCCSGSFYLEDDGHKKVTGKRGELIDRLSIVFNKA